MVIKYETNIEKVLKKRADNNPPKFYDVINKELRENTFFSQNKIIYEKLDPKKIFHIKDIKKVCVDYRLRFLDSSFYKGKIPNVALKKIDLLQKEHSTSLNSFKIMGPSSVFQLEKKDDPLLFFQISKNYFYLIHKWGTDFSVLRRVFVWPFKNLNTLLFSLFFISLLFTKLVPEGLFSHSMDFKSFWIIHLFILKGLMSIAIFYGFAFGKNFNVNIWNNKFDKF